ncbi:MAG: class I SAM-dependent methyltransferase [Euryarchaeota archaeon]|nr:class I SAM-dependent methyltransferase [Euryarchaeota archaeon]
MEFYDIEADMYDLFYFDYDADVKIYREYAKDCDAVLELMCGTGRVMYHLRHKNMWGVDINEKMLARARENLKDMNVTLVRGDARDFNLVRRFGLVIIALNSLAMFPKEDRIKILKSAYAHLEQGGRIIVDVFNPYEMVIGIVHHGDTKIKDGVIYSRFFVPLSAGDHWDILYFYDIVRDDVVRRKVARLPLYPVSYEDLGSEFSEAGFSVENVFGSHDMDEFDEENSERIIMVGVKNDED